MAEEEKRAAELAIELQTRMQKGHGGKRTRLQKSEIQLRDAILEEYYSLIEGSKPKRKYKFGYHYYFQDGLKYPPPA